MHHLTTLLLLTLMLAAPLHISASPESRAPTPVTFTAELPPAGSLVLGVYEDGALGGLGRALDDGANGALSAAIETHGFEGEMGSSQLIALPAPAGRRLLLIGLGDLDKTRDPLAWQTVGGTAVQAAIAVFDTVPPLVFDAPAESTSHFAFGAKLGSYVFDKYFSDKERTTVLDTLTIVTPRADAATDAFGESSSPVADAVWYARDVSNEPANVMYPQQFVETWQDHFKRLDDVSVSVLDQKAMQKLGMGALLGVGRGSDRPPRLLIVEYRGGDKDDAPVVIVGKGITFDTGGISLKRSSKLHNMKFDMSGAASAMGTLYAVAATGVPMNVVGIAALAENMPDGGAQRPGDIVTTMSGKTIEIRNTDAEGRLVLADAVHYADITYDPSLLVDLATLTGAAARALGTDYAALLTRDPTLVPAFEQAARDSGEGVWHMPLDEAHFNAIQSPVADLLNAGAKGPGMSTGAALIGEFVRESTPWVHFDIAGVAYSDETSPLKGSPGSNGFGVRLLYSYMRTLSNTQ